MKKLLLAGLIGMWATVASAHSPLKGTTPANDATVTQVPSDILFDFKGDIRLTRVTMIYAGSGSTDLDLSGHEGFISEYQIPLQGMGRGLYKIEWRGLGDDGHALNGTFNFTVE